MLALLRASLRQQPCEALPPQVDWHRLFLIARQHGVVTLLYDAIVRLPAQLQPQGDDAISWTLSAERTRQHFAQQTAVLQQLAEKANKADLPMLLVKGNDLARLYPVPDSRACGDIDLFFFDRYSDGNALLGNPDAPLDGKHSSHHVDGVEVENHLFFLDQNQVRQRRAERYIHSTLPQAWRDSMGVFHLSPLGNMVYLLMHTVCHLTAKYKLPLRNLLDWGLFLHAYRNELSPDQCRKVVRSIGMSNAFNLLTFLAGDLLDLDFSSYLYGKHWRKDTERMRALILHKAYLPHVEESLSFHNQLKQRIQRYRQRHWLYRYLPYTRHEQICNILAKQWHSWTGKH